MSFLRPTAVQTITNDNFISLLDVIRPTNDIRLYERFSMDYYMSDTLEVTGRMKSVENGLYSHYEEDDMLQYITNRNSVTQATPGAAATITLAVADHFSSGLYSFPEFREVVLINAAVPIPCIINAKNTGTPGAHTITIQPLDATQAIGTIAAGQNLAISGKLNVSGGTNDGSKGPRLIKVSNYTSIIDKALQIDGSSLTTPTWFEVTSTEGVGGGYLYYLEAERNTAVVFKSYTEMQMLTSRKSAGTVITNLGTVQTTEGLFPSIENNGGVVINYPAGGFNLNTLRLICSQFAAGGGAKEYQWYMAFDLYSQVQNFIQDAMRNGSILYGSFNGKKDLSVSMNFSSFEYLGYTFHLKNYMLLNNQNGLGTPGYNYSGYGVMIPWGMASEAKTGKMEPLLSINYRKSSKGYSREFEYWKTGAANGTYTNQTDNNTINYRSEKGFEGYCMNKFCLCKPV